MKAYSTDLRERVLAAHARGLSRRELIELFQVSQGSITRWLRQQRVSGDLTPRTPPGRTRSIPAEQEAALRRQLEAAPDATLATHVAQWAAAYGTSLSTWTMARAIRHIGWSRKKSL
jgi:putative transposase